MAASHCDPDLSVKGRVRAAETRFYPIGDLLARVERS